MRRALLIHNPTAGNRRWARRLPKIVARLGEQGFAVEVATTATPDEASRRAAEASGCAAVFSLGGDGSLRRVAAGLLDGAVPLGILPGGTTNVVARALGLPLDPLAVAAIAGRLVPRPIDVGFAAGQPFLMSASAGFDAAAIARVDPRWKRRLGRGAVLLQGVAEWWRDRGAEISLEVDGTAVREARLAIAANLPLYAGACRLAPEARCDDGRLDLVTFSGVGRVATLGFAVALVRGRHLGRADVAIRPARRIRLLGPAGLRMQIDGDPLPAEPPIEITVAAGRLRVLTPAGPAELRSRGAGAARHATS